MIGTRSYMAKGEEVERKWYLIDATDKHLGRLAVQVARILSGKHKPTYTPHVDTGDFVVVINADKVGLTGKKLIQSLPKTKLGRDMYRKLKVYAGPAHPHAAQKPEQID